MPVMKTGSKFKSSIKIFIFSLLITLIPLGIILAISFSNSDIWTFSYTYYVFSCIAAMLYFALYNGLIASRSRRGYIVYRYVTYAILVATIVVCYLFRTQTYEVSFNIAAMVLFVYSVYQFTDNSDNKEDVIFRYFVPLVIVVIGLVPNLWFLSMGWTIATSVVAFIAFIPSVIAALILTINYHRKGYLENAVLDEFEYTESTDSDLHEDDSKLEGIELSGDATSEWKMSNSTIDYLKRSANDFYNTASRKLSEYIREKEKDYQQAKFNYEHNSFSDSEKAYGKALDTYNYYVDCYNNLKKDYEEIMHDIEAFANVRITSKDYGKYIVFDFIKRYDVKKSYSNKNACKVCIRTFTKTYRMKKDYPGVEVPFGSIISTYTEFTKIK